MTVFNDIRAALEQRLDTVTGVPSAANRAWENVRFDPVEGTTWVRLTLLPTMRRPAVRGSNPQQRYDGLFQVSVITPEGQGPGAAETLADNIMAAYTVDDVLTSNSTNVRFDYAERAEGMADSPWYMIPVTIAWYSYGN